MVVVVVVVVWLLSENEISERKRDEKRKRVDTYHISRV